VSVVGWCGPLETKKKPTGHSKGQKSKGKILLEGGKGTGGRTSGAPEAVWEYAAQFKVKKVKRAVRGQHRAGGWKVRQREKRREWGKFEKGRSLTSLLSSVVGRRGGEAIVFGRFGHDGCWTSGPS